MTLFLRILAAAGLLFSLTLPAKAQRWEEAWTLLKAKQADTARVVIDLETASEPGKSLAMSWYVRGMIYKTLYDSDGSADKYKGEEVEFNAFEAYRKAISLDNTQELTEGILEDVLALTEDFAQTGLALFENGYETHDAATLEKAAHYMDCVSESFALLGPRQVGLHQEFKEFGIDKKMFEVCRALAKDGSNQRDEAARIYEQLVKEKVQDPAVYMNLKEIYLLHGEKRKALETLQVGRKMAPTNLEISCDYAELLADSGKYHDSMALLKSLMRAHPDESRPFAAAGFIEEKKSNSQQAEAWYHKALDVEPTAFLPNFRMGKLFFKRAEEEKRKKATQAYVKHLQETSLEFAEAAYQQDMHHPGNTRILIELYNALGMSAKAAQIKSVAGQGS